MPNTVWVTHWHSEYSDEYWAHSSESRAYHNLFEQIKDCWMESYQGPIPTDEREAVSKYFEDNEEEWVNIEAVEVDAEEAVLNNARA
jgi:hypothetical protein